MIAIVSILAAVPLGLYGMYFTYNKIKYLKSYIEVHYQPILINTIINYTPISVIRLGNLLYDRRYIIIIAAVIVRWTRLNDYAVFRWPIKGLFGIKRIIDDIVWFPYNMAKKVFFPTVAYTGEIAYFMG
jgi:hypothetical protein